MSQIPSLAFNDAQLLPALTAASDDELDLLEFGLIGFDGDGVVRAYNVCESKFAGLSADRVKNHPLFTAVAPCMNNFLVAQRFQDAAAAIQPLDVTIDYVLTLRMRPVKVRLRLLADPSAALRYVLVLPRQPADDPASDTRRRAAASAALPTSEPASTSSTTTNSSASSPTAN